MDTTQNVVLSVPWVTLAVGSVIPLVVAAVAKWDTASRWKGWCSAALIAITAALTQLIDNGGSLPLVDFLAALLATGGAHQVAYETVWKDSGIKKALAHAGGILPAGEPEVVG